MTNLSAYLNWTTLLPIFCAFSILVWAAWLISKKGARRFGWPISRRVRHLHLLRSFIPLLPLTGIFGTIWSLVITLGFMAEQANKTGISDALPDVLARFAPAILSTGAGVVGAFFCIITIESGLHHLEYSNNETA